MEDVLALQSFLIDTVVIAICQMSLLAYNLVMVSWSETF